MKLSYKYTHLEQKNQDNSVSEQYSLSLVFLKRKRVTTKGASSITYIKVHQTFVRKGCMQQENYCFDIEKLKVKLLQNGLTFFYHSNTVDTSLSFFRLANLASREYLESQGMPQTMQPSDSNDKKFGIYNDLFLNLSDFHGKFRKKQPNLYGPILFKYPVEKVLNYFSENKFEIRMTQKQPHKWEDNDSASDRWTLDIESRLLRPISNGWATWPDIVARGVPPFLPLALATEILIDPHPTSSNFLRNFRKAVSNAMSSQNLTVKLRTRNCSIINCNCMSTDSLSYRRRQQYKFSS